MRIKKLLLMMVLLTIAGKAFADEIAVSPVSMNAGETKQFEVNLVLSSESYSALQFDLVMPKGISVVAKNSKLQIALSNAHRQYDEFEEQYSHSVSSSQTASDENSTTYTVVIYDANNQYLKAGSGAIVKVNIAADANASGELTAYVKNILVAASGGSGGVSGGANLTDVSFNITVAGKPTVTAANKSREYGEANPELTYTVSDGTITGTPVLTTTATATSPVGDYPIVVPTSDDYNAVNGTLTVTKAPLTISGGTYSIKQGEALPTFVAEYSGFKNDETSTVLTTQPTLTLENGVTSASEPGTYTITVAGATATNYNITHQNGTLTITAADPVVVTAQSYEITYGDALPNFGYTSEGATLSGTPELTCAATADSNAGTYDIVVSQGSVTNFNVTYVKGTLTIKKAPLTITAEDKSKSYGDENPVFTASYTGFVKNQDNSVLTTKPTLSTDATAATGAGTYPITASGAVADNYTFTYVNGTLTINPLVATLTWSNTELTYNGQEQKPTATVSNLIGNDACVVTVSGATNAGNYTSTASELSNANYKLPEAADDKSQAFNIAQLEAVLAWSNTELTYNGQEQKPTATVSNLIGNDQCTVTVSGATNAGNYTSTASELSNANYKLPEAKTQAFTIAQVPLTISGGTYSIKQGEALPTFVAEYSGFINDETSAVLTTQPTLTLESGVTSASEPGTYTITVAGATATNYNITHQNGTLTITAADPVVLTAQSYEITYGDALPNFGYTSEGATLSGTPEITCAATADSNAGTYDIVVSQGSVTNFNVTYVKGTLTIKKAPLTITAEDKSKSYGDENPEFTASYTGFVKNQDNSVLTTKPTLSTEATAATGAGTYPITANGAVADNYTFTYVNGTLTINPLVATLTWSNTELTYNGQEQKPTATVSNLVGNDACVVTVSGATNAGNYTSTASELSNANYKLPEAADDKSQAFSIDQLEAVLAWSNTELTYNGQEQKPTATVSNLIGNDACVVTVSGATNAGNHTSTASELSNANYKLPETKTQAFTIAQTTLTISCGTYTMKQGEALPEFQAEYSGFVNGENENVLDSKPTLSTTATSTSNRGNYDVVVSGALAANYDIAYQNGTLIITEVVVNDGGTTIEQGEDGYYVVTIDEESGGTSESGVIDDTQLDNEGKIEVAELIYTRELDAPSGSTGDATIEGSAAKLYTTCLAEAPTTAANVKYYTLDAANSTTLTFVEVISPAANTPYLVAVTSGSDLNESQNVTNVTLKKEADNSTEKDGFVFKGTLTGLSNTDAAATGVYILQSGNVWGKVTTAKPAAYIPPFRAYIVSTSATAPDMLNGSLGDDNTTGIQNIRTIDKDGRECWYDLNGKRIQKPTKGINIKNGRKIVVK